MPLDKVDAIIAQCQTTLNESELLELRQQAEIGKKSLRFCTIKDNDELVAHLTGLPTAKTFMLLLQLLCRFKLNYYYGWAVDSVSLEDQLFITLRKLRSNIASTTLAWEYSVSKTTIANIFLTWVHAMWEVLFEGMMKRMPSRMKNQTSLPSSFASFSNCRVIIDCTEVRVAIPSLFKNQSQTFSHYKHFHTFKALVGVAPNAVITFVSNLYPGSTSDKAIVAHCGILEQLECGDLILADKGFLISDILPTGVTVNIPPFLSNGQFTREQCILTRNIARARIHVERANARIKSFQILTFIPAQYRDLSSKIFQVCAALVNLQYPLLKEVETTLL